MTVILEAIVGSTAYGLATPESDIDKLGVFVLPTAEFSRLALPKDSDFSRVQHEPDVTHQELGKFCRLALQCNPTILELLWVPERLLTVMSEDGRQLRQRREWFLDPKKVHDAYMGYAVSQFKRLSERGDFGADMRKRTEKHARHLLRLMHQGYTLYTTGNLPIVLEDPWRYREFGILTADNPSHAKQTLEQYGNMFADAKTVLRESDPHPVDLWLRSIRKKY